MYSWLYTNMNRIKYPLHTCVRTLEAFVTFFSKLVSKRTLTRSSRCHHRTTRIRLPEMREYALFFLLCTTTNTLLSFAYQNTPPPPDPPAIKMRAWQCHGRTNRELVNNLASAGIITSPVVKKVMTLVDRANYVPQRPYDDTPQSIGWGQTISAPHMHAHALELIVPTLEKSSSPLTLLDVGCGSGYLTAAMGRMVDAKDPLVGSGGKVFAVDVFPGLVEMTKENVKKQDGDLLTDGTVTVQLGDGWKGLKEKGPFDAIHVGAAADSFPKELMMQLKPGGVLIVPVGPDGGAQVLYRIEKTNDRPDFHQEDFNFRELLGVRYVPLLHGRS